jgi:lactoylglutathione lyase
MIVKRLTPNLYTDDVESCVKFWVERMHFEKTVEVPDEGRIAFAALQSGGIEVMYGTWASLEKEPGVTGSFQRGTGFLFIEVDDLDAVLDAMKGVPVVLPVHKTFYGATEFTVKDPAGHLITFAHFG